MPRIDPFLLRLLLRRGAWLWLGSRLMLSAALVLATPPGDPQTLALGLITTLWYVLAVALVVWFDLVRRRELLLLGNLGIAPWAAVGLTCAPVLGAEVAITLLLA